MAAEVKSGDFRLKFLMTMKTMHGWSVLQKALEKKSKAARQKILTESFHQKELEMAVEIACKLGMLGAVQFLVEKCDIDVEKIKNACVWSAASGRHSNIVKYFIENLSVDVNLPNDKGMAAIHFACVSGDEHLVEYLVSKGARLTDTDNKNVNCLMAGAWAGSVKICEMAIKAGVDVNAKNSSDEHILHGTIRQGFNVDENRLHVIDFLVKAGANVNSVNAANIPVVIYAALTFKSCTKTLGYFLKHPQVNMRDKIDAMKYGGAFLISTGNSKRGFKFWTRAVELQEKLKFAEDENNNSAPCHSDFSSYEPTCIEDIHRMKENPVRPIYFMFALLSKLHVKYSYNCIPCLEGLTDVIISLGCYSFFLEVFAFTFLHTFSNNENVDAIPGYESAFRTICVIIAWKEKKGDEIFPEVLEFFKKMTRGFEMKQPCCKKIMEDEAEEISQTERDLRAIIAHAIDLFCPPGEEDEDSDSDSCSYYGDYKDGKQRNMYMKLMMQLSALILGIFPTHREDFLPCLYKLLETKFRDEKRVTFLHIAIECMDTSQDYHADEETHAELVKILIENGEDVNATDNYLCSPVHELASVVHCENLSLVQEIVDLMVQHGAHLDMRNKLGWSALNDLIDSEVKVNPAANQTLQCLAAEVIMEENLDYQSTTPKALWDFIQQHDPEERMDECKIPYASTLYSQERFWCNVEEHVCDV
ncbi:protein fem-1 homolog CG6966-like [Saccostrea cucullata]|uniref:protein fem-1 homolog CG6966-like n=1 Tax=Saccostrea cuccullata TaxID=36930 RepID=UPI002ED2328E